MDFEDGVLIITDSIAVDATVVMWAIQHFSVGLKGLRIITQASLLGHAEGSLYFKSSSLSTIVSISENPGFHNQLWLLKLAKVLKPGGYLFLQEPSFFLRNKDIVLGESRACLERNLLFSGFYAIEDFECLEHSAEISCSPQDFEFIAIKAKKAHDTAAGSGMQGAHFHKTQNSVIAVDDTLQQQIEDYNYLIDEDTLFTAEDSNRPELPQDESSSTRERIRERNRLYQRRRRARMTEEQRNREKEKRRRYMQSRRVQPVSYEIPVSIPVSYGGAEEHEQRLHSGQQLQESHIIEI